MKITLAMVLSVDGKSTKWDLPDQSWASEEDKLHLIKLISENNLILMGGKTYESAKTHISPKEGKLRIVLTRNPQKFSGEEIPGQLEFVNQPVEELIKDLEYKGFNKMLLLSGEGLNKELFEAGLIDEIILTVEPKIFGSGRGMVSGAKLDLNLKLLKHEKLNGQGTMLLHYRVLK